MTRAEREGGVNGRYRDVDGILRIVRDGLCHRCGACIGICPAGTFSLGPAGYPVATGKCVECDKCVQVCSGIGVDFPSLGTALYGEEYRYGQLLGPVKASYIGHAAEGGIRRAGASGGLVTQLLVHLLESGRITGALVVVQDPDNPSMAKGTIARSRAELLAAAQSKYTTSPSLSALRELKGADGPVAVVCVPCQAHALRKAMAADRKLARRVSLLIGLYCHSKLSCTGMQSLAAVVSGRRQVRRVRYRQKDGSGWPHNTVEIDFTDGSRWRSPLGPAETMNILYGFTPLRRCLTCLDFGAEFADLAVGDPWIRDEQGEWKYPDPGGQSSVIVHTAAGEEALLSAREKGRIELRAIPAVEIERGQHATISEKKQRIPFRLSLMRSAGRQVPAYPVPRPRPALGVVLHEVLSAALRQVFRFEPPRRFALRLAFSPLGVALVELRSRQKKRRFRRRGRTAEK